MVKNFRFEQEGALALSGVPETPDAVDWLHAQGIRTVVSLHPVSADVERRMAERGIVWLPYLIQDFAQGVPAGFPALCERISARIAEDPAVLIH